jgi:uncharacterized protein (DUF1800 family)
MNETLRALNRFGLGARVGEAARVRDPRNWLLSQLDAGPPALQDPGLPTLAEAGAAFRAQRQGLANQDPEERRMQLATSQQVRQAEIGAALNLRVTTDRPFVERLVAFWSNHLCVSMAGGPQVASFAGHYEREVIRPHVLGRFTDMVLASARHPAMLFYLDNLQSIGPESQQARAAARRQGRERGLNENYARELLELHTLGVDGGYTQADVEAMAKILTGWTLSGVGPGAAAEPFGFSFRAMTHEPGTKTVLGKEYRQAGLAEGESAIRDLCAHPSTARFVATKLVTHFVSDVPPEPAVDRIASVFRETAGDLKAVSAFLVTLEEAWDPGRRKFRTPQDWLVAMLRAGPARQVPPALAQGLNQLRHPLWAPSSPKGFGDMLGDWGDPDGLMNRAELARTAVQRMGRAGVEPGRLVEVMDLPVDDPLPAFLADASIPADERLALAFGGPAFQWR